MIGVALLAQAATIGNTFLAVRVAQSFAADVRSAAFHKIQKFSFGNLDKFQTGQLIVRLTSDVNSVQMMVMMGLRMFISAPIMIVGSIVIMFIINAELAKNRPPPTPLHPPTRRRLRLEGSTNVP